jgi:hypothetical protein
MTYKPLIRRLQISCLGLDPIDPLRLLVDDVIEALREHAMYEVQRLGQEIEQEPVATVTSETGADITMSWWHEPALPIGTKLYTHPPQLEQNFCPRCGKRTNDIHTCTPPQRTWVGLTKDEVDSWNLPDHPTVFEFAQFIESKLKEKNI